MDTPNEERFFRVTLSEHQHAIVECALRTLSAGDPDSEEENEATISAFLSTTESVT